MKDNTDEMRSTLVKYIFKDDASKETLETALNLFTSGNQNITQDRYLSIKDAQQYTTLSRITLWTHRKNGRLKYHKVGGRVVFKKSDLDLLITG